MNGINDWGNQHPYEQQAQPSDFDQVDEFIDEEVPAQDAGSVVSEALKRIEQAKLYESLLRHPLFAPGSARPEIMDAVQEEIRAFILERLETLVGLRHPQVQKSNAAALGLTEEQVSALKVLADRMIQKNNESRLANPQVMPLQATESVTPQQAAPVQPVVQPLPAPRSSAGIPRGPIAQPQAQPQKAPARRRAAPKPQQSAAQPGEPVGPQDPNDPKIRHRQGQVVSRTHRPIPMPSAAQEASMHAAEVGKTSASLQGAQGGLQQLLNIAVMDAQNKNRNVREE